MPNQCVNILEVHGPDDARAAAARFLVSDVFYGSLRADESQPPDRKTLGAQNSPVRSLAFYTEREPPLELLADLSDKFPRHEFRLQFENQASGFRGSACFLGGVCRDHLREGASPREQAPEPRQPRVESNAKRDPKTPLPMPTSLKEAARQLYESGVEINCHEIYPEFVMSYYERLEMERFFRAYEVIREICSAEDQLELTAMEQAHREYLETLTARGKAEHDLRQAIKVIRRPEIVGLLDAAGQAVVEEAIQLLDRIRKGMWSDLPPDPSSVRC